MFPNVFMNKLVGVTINTSRILLILYWFSPVSIIIILYIIFFQMPSSAHAGVYVFNNVQFNKQIRLKFQQNV